MKHIFALGAFGALQTVSLVSAEDGPPPGWVPPTCRKLGSKVYCREYENVDWATAKANAEGKTFQWCETETVPNGRLATFETEAEQAWALDKTQDFYPIFTYNLGGFNQVWVGAHQKQGATSPGDGWEWQYPDGSKTSFSTPAGRWWSNTAPNDVDGNEDGEAQCLSIYEPDALGQADEFGWNDDLCGTKMPYIVEYDCSPPQEQQPTGGAVGDPHFLSWNGEWFDFHGICDLVLLQAPGFDNGMGLNMHIRTKARYQYSYIETVAIQMGNDVLEISSFGQYSLNGVTGASMPVMIGSLHVVSYTQVDTNKHVFKITLDDELEEAIVVSTFKDMVSVTVQNASVGSFGASQGMMGSFPEGIHLARDGVTVMDDPNAFGQEWQILQTEPQLFEQPSIYMGQGCVPPAPKKESRRLGESIAMEAAEKACAIYGEGAKKDMCVFDVMAMGDLEVAEVHGVY